MLKVVSIVLNVLALSIIMDVAEKAGYSQLAQWAIGTAVMVVFLAADKCWVAQ